jgi:hypothetical protein
MTRPSPLVRRETVASPSRRLSMSGADDDGLRELPVSAKSSPPKLNTEVDEWLVILKDRASAPCSRHGTSRSSSAGIAAATELLMG